MQDLTTVRAKYHDHGQPGDMQRVANKLGKSRELVKKVMQGKRQNQDVLDELVKLLDLRAAAEKKFQEA